MSWRRWSKIGKLKEKQVPPKEINLVSIYTVGLVTSIIVKKGKSCPKKQEKDPHAQAGDAKA